MLINKYHIRYFSAQGIFADDPPCPIKNTNGFNKSEETQSCYMMEPTYVIYRQTDSLINRPTDSRIDLNYVRNHHFVHELCRLD